MKSVDIRYHLKTKSPMPPASQRTKKEPVYAEFSGGFFYIVDGKKIYKKFKYSLQCKILPQHFGLFDDKGTVKFDIEIFKKFSKLNMLVKTKMNLLEAASNKCEVHFTTMQHTPTAEEFQRELLTRLGKKDREEAKTYTILPYLKKKIEYFKSIKGSGRKDELEDETIKVYGTLAGYIENYENVKNYKLTFENFNEAKYWDFWTVADEIVLGKIIPPERDGHRRQSIKPTGLMMSSVRKYQKTFMRVLKMANTKDKIKVTLDYSDANLILEDKPSAKDIFINDENLKTVTEYIASDYELQLAKDYIIIASLTGMRFQSMDEANIAEISVCNEMGYNFKYIHSIQEKTKTQCFIPLFEPVREIIERRGGKFPVVPNNATSNKLFKKLFAEAGITATATLVKHTYSQGIVTEQKQINEIVSSHDFRKTFYTILSQMGLPQHVIEYVTHPDKVSTTMAGYYDKRTMMHKAQTFVDEFNKLSPSELYRL